MITYSLGKCFTPELEPHTDSYFENQTKPERLGACFRSPAEAKQTAQIYFLSKHINGGCK